MSLEIAIQENTSALRELIAAISKGIPTTSTQLAAVIAEAPVKVEETGKAKEPEVTAASAPVTATIVDYEAVKKATLELSKAKGREATVAVLKRFGAEKAPDLKPEQYADYVAAAAETVGA